MRFTCKWAGSICSWISHVDSHGSSAPSTRFPHWQADHALSQHHLQPANYLLYWTCFDSFPWRMRWEWRKQGWGEQPKPDLVFGYTSWALRIDYSVARILPQAHPRGQLNPACLAEKGALLGPLIQALILSPGWLQSLPSWSLSSSSTPPPIYPTLAVRFCWIMSPVSSNTFSVCLGNNIPGPGSVFKTPPGGDPHSRYESCDSTQPRPNTNMLLCTPHM